MIARCPACAQLFPVLGNARAPCPFCGTPLEIRIQRLGPLDAREGDTPGTEVDQDGPPEGPGPGSSTRAPREPMGHLFATLYAFLASPRRAFEDARAAPIPAAIAFLATVLLVPIGFELAILFVLLTRPELWPRALPVSFADQGALAASLAALLPAALFGAIFLATTYQVASTLVSGRRPDATLTIRVVCFGFAPMVAGLVPLIGLPIGLAWSLFLHGVGLRVLHGLGRVQAAVVVFVPLLVILASLVYG